MGFVRKKTGIDLTGGGAVDAAGEAARRQRKASEKGLKILRADLEPFRTQGADAANLLLQSIMGVDSTVGEDGQTQFGIGQFDQSLVPQAPDLNVSAESILNNPFFQALSQEQEESILNQRAALGLQGSGGTADLLNRSLLSLGNDFRQQEIGNRQLDFTNQRNILSDAMAMNQNRFNNLFNTATMGSNAAAQTGTSTLNTMNQIGQANSVAPILQGQVGAQQGQQLLGMLGSMSQAGGQGQSLGGGISNIAAFLGMASDRRLKSDIRKISDDEFGGVYRFRYKGDHQEYEGRIAQELQESRPDAVYEHESGYLFVTEEFKPRMV